MSLLLPAKNEKCVGFVTYFPLLIGNKYAIILPTEEVYVKLRKLTFYLLVLGMLFSIPACKKADNVFPDNAEGVLTDYTGCKNTGLRQNAAVNRTSQKVQECIDYQYNGENTLLLNHTNAVFNCCPGTISADTNFSQGLIEIVEREADHGCRCICHYDLDYHFNNIPPGVYTVRITCEAGQVREYTIDLNSSYSGSKCWDCPLQTE